MFADNHTIESAAPFRLYSLDRCQITHRLKIRTINYIYGCKSYFMSKFYEVDLSLKFTL